MAIKVLIKRRFKEAYFNEINKMIQEVRYGAMGQEGYISSETLWDHEDPFRVVVASNWQSIENWNNWKNSDSRQSQEQKYGEFLDGETEYEAFHLGVYPH
jgi:heme-degrading monooxygenase HmoA